MNQCQTAGATSSNLALLESEVHPSEMAGTSFPIAMTPPTTGAETALQQMAASRPRLTLVSLPDEIRDLIWDKMVEEIDESRRSDWSSRPKVEFLALMYTCRQLYHEIREFQPQGLVPYPRFIDFTKYLFKPFEKDYRSDILPKFRSLAIEFRLTASALMFTGLTRVLKKCSPNLGELRLYFIGPDRYGTQTHLQGCAYAPDVGRPRKLPLDGQRKLEMLSIQQAIHQMRRLRILVLSNMNAPLVQGMFRYKPALEYVHLTADHRSVVHRAFSLDDLGSLAMPPVHDHPPVKVLHIAANSTVAAYAFAAHCAPTLEHLTWTIPEPSLGSNGMRVNLARNTTNLMRILAQHSKLHTLRICIEAGATVMTPGASPYYAALRLEIGNIESLRHYELHVTQGLEWSTDVLLGIPQQVECFYTNDAVIRPKELYAFLMQKYLTSRPPMSDEAGVSLALTGDDRIPVNTQDGNHPWFEPQPPAMSSLSQDLWPEYYDCDDQQSGPIVLWMHPFSYVPTYDMETHSLCGTPVVRLSGKKVSADCDRLYLDGIIGELPNRRDHIPLHTGELRLFAYEFRNPDWHCSTSWFGESQTQMVLRLNGRLVDRHHNFHLRPYNLGQTIPPKKASNAATHDRETMFRSDNPDIAALLDRLYDVEHTDQRDVEAIKQEWESVRLRPNRYFGNENQAMKVFQQEQVAHPDQLQRRRDLCTVDSEFDHKCRFMSPEYDVPTLAQLERA